MDYSSIDFSRYLFLMLRFFSERCVRSGSESILFFGMLKSLVSLEILEAEKRKFSESERTSFGLTQNLQNFIFQIGTYVYKFEKDSTDVASESVHLR